MDCFCPEMKKSSPIIGLLTFGSKGNFSVKSHFSLHRNQSLQIADYPVHTYRN